MDRFQLSTQFGVGGDLRRSTRLHVIRLPRSAEQPWSVRDPYFELMWIAPLGVTTCAVARRLKLHTTTRPAVHPTSLSALATSLPATPAKVLRSLRRLHHHGLVVWREHVSVIGVHGLCQIGRTSGVVALRVRVLRALSTGDVGDRACALVSDPSASSTSGACPSAAARLAVRATPFAGRHAGRGRLDRCAVLPCAALCVGLSALGAVVGFDSVGVARLACSGPALCAGFEGSGLLVSPSEAPLQVALPGNLRPRGLRTRLTNDLFDSGASPARLVAW